MWKRPWSLQTCQASAGFPTPPQSGCVESRYEWRSEASWLNDTGPVMLLQGMTSNSWATSTLCTLQRSIPRCFNLLLVLRLVPCTLWPWLSNIRPNSFQALFGNRHSQGPFPVGSLDTAALFWKVGEFNEWMQAFLCQLASGPQNGPGRV